MVRDSGGIFDDMGETQETKTWLLTYAIDSDNGMDLECIDRTEIDDFDCLQAALAVYSSYCGEYHVRVIVNEPDGETYKWDSWK